MHVKHSCLVINIVFSSSFFIVRSFSSPFLCLRDGSSQRKPALSCLHSELCWTTMHSHRATQSPASRFAHFLRHFRTFHVSAQLTASDISSRIVAGSWCIAALWLSQLQQGQVGWFQAETCFVFMWIIKLYNVISIFLSLHLLLSFPSLSAYLLFLFFPPTISPLWRSLPYITLQQAPSKQRCLVSVLYHDHNPLPSSLTPTFCVSLCSYSPLLFLVHCCHSAFISHVLPYSGKHTKWDRNH